MPRNFLPCPLPILAVKQQGYAGRAFGHQIDRAIGDYIAPVSFLSEAGIVAAAPDRLAGGMDEALQRPIPGRQRRAFMFLLGSGE